VVVSLLASLAAMCHPVSFSGISTQRQMLRAPRREAIRGARLVANPGCYPTSVQLPLVPLLEAGLVLKEDIIVDAKSGVSGAGETTGVELG